MTSSRGVAILANVLTQSWGADEVSAPQFCWNELRASQLCWRLNRPLGGLSWPGVVEGFALGWPEFGCGVTSGLTGCTAG